MNCPICNNKCQHFDSDSTSWINILEHYRCSASNKHEFYLCPATKIKSVEYDDYQFYYNGNTNITTISFENKSIQVSGVINFNSLEQIISYIEKLNKIKIFQ